MEGAWERTSERVFSKAAKRTRSRQFDRILIKTRKRKSQSDRSKPQPERNRTYSRPSTTPQQVPHVQIEIDKVVVLIPVSVLGSTGEVDGSRGVDEVGGEEGVGV